MRAIRLCAALALLLPTSACRTPGTDVSETLESSVCENRQTFAVVAPPGYVGDALVKDDSDSMTGRIVDDRRGFYLSYCPSSGTLASATTTIDNSGIISLEHSTAARLTAQSGVTQAFTENRADLLSLDFASRDLRFRGALLGGQPVVFIGTLEDSPFAPAPRVGRLAPVADFPRPESLPPPPVTHAPFLVCDPGSEAHSFSDASIERGSDQLQFQIDVCMDPADVVVKSALLLVIKSFSETQAQTDVIQIPAIDTSGAAGVVFGDVSPTTRLVFSTPEPQGRNAVSEVSLTGRTDGTLDFAIDGAIVGPVAVEFGTLAASGDCRPGEDLGRSVLRFDVPSGAVAVTLRVCQVFQFGATGTIQYRLKEVEVDDPDPRLVARVRSLAGAELASRAKLMVSHHNSCDKLTIEFDDVHYGFTSPETFSIGNDCEDDDGLAPANPHRDLMMIRRRVVADEQVDSLSVPWGKALVYAPKLVLTPESDPLE